MPKHRAPLRSETVFGIVTSVERSGKPNWKESAREVRTAKAPEGGEGQKRKQQFWDKSR